MPLVKLIHNKEAGRTVRFVTGIPITEWRERYEKMGSDSVHLTSMVDCLKVQKFDKWGNPKRN